MPITNILVSQAYYKVFLQLLKNKDNYVHKSEAQKKRRKINTDKNKVAGHIIYIVVF